MAGKSTHEVKTWVAALPPLPPFLLLATGAAKAVIPPDPGVDRRIRLPERYYTELNRTEYAGEHHDLPTANRSRSSRFLEVQEAGETLRVHFNDVGRAMRPSCCCMALVLARRAGKLQP